MKLCRAAALAAALATALGAAGCAPGAATKTAQPQRPLPQGGPPSVETITASLARRDAALSSLRAQARLSYESPHEKGRVAQMMVIQAPDRLRIDLMSPFGPTYTLAIDGKRLAAYDRAEKVVYRGLAGVQNLRRYARVGLAPAALASVLRGLPPWPPAGRDSVKASRGGWRWRRETGGGRRLEVLLAEQDLQPLALELKEPGLELAASFSDFREVDGVIFPHAVAVDLGAEGRVELAYERVWRGIALGDKAFVLALPPGVRTVDMDGESR